MNRVQRSQLVAIACLTLLFGCAAGPGGPGEPAAGQCRPIGDLSPLGQGNVYLNGRRIDRRTRVCEGDRVSTGPDSGAWVAFVAGGHLHFDERTDPIFRLLRDLVIEVLDLNRGQVHAEPPPGGQLVIRNPDGALETLGTALNLRVEAERSLLTVLDGRVRLLQPPAGLVRASEQVGLRRGELLYRRALSFAELQEVVRWRERYPPPEADGAKAEPSTVEKALPWVIGAAILGTVLPKILNKDDGYKGDKPTSRYPLNQDSVVD